ncbi:NosD domain-containing protein [Acinetobacter baumannii]|uniref:NosD domain-containing protein n=1 Tax=Acinetobacter baumannii TaxID=470 RepID=UPI0025A0F407|nr:NosD domain-containing protein [Acinetobacter baumannii]
MSSKLQSPFPLLPDIDGRPLDGGYVYIGEAGKNPEVYPIPVFWDEGLTVPAGQPIRTRNGYFARYGQAGKIYIGVDSCSITLKNKKKLVVSSDLKTDLNLTENGFFEKSKANVTIVDSVNDLNDLEKWHGRTVRTRSFNVPNYALATPFKGAATYTYDLASALINDGVVCIYGWKLNAIKLNPYICGAYGDGFADDTVAMKNWLDLTESYGFGEAELPEGSYIYKESLNVGGTTSIKGCGQKSVLRPTGCHGLNFLRSDAVGARSITDFWIYPQNGTSFYGLYANLNTPTDRITGVLFKNIYVSWMLGTAYLKGVWHSCFENIYSINNYRGIKLVGQNVKVDIKTCWLIRGNTSNIGDNLDSYGVSIEYDSENVRSEDIKISRCIIYGYDRGVNVVSVLNGAIQNCDIDFALSYGIYCSVLDGGFAIQDNWIAITANATSPIYGIYFSALGSAKETTRTITNNYVVHYGSSPVTASTGIYLGSNQRMVKIADNTVLSFSYGIYGDGADYTKILDNTIDAKTYSIFLYSVKNTQINGNFLNQLIFCYPFNVNYTDFGINFSEVNTGLKSTASILSGTTSITINFDKPIYVGLPTYLYPVCEIIGAQGINYTFLGDGTQKTGITFTVGSAPSSDLQFAYKISTFNRIS